jgi:Asp-tRNA(Asn)/Glu-tRNA(Gln) amidotransferase B subunit
MALAIQAGESHEYLRGLVGRLGLTACSPDVIEAAVADVLAAHPDKVAQYKGGRVKLLGFFVGQALKIVGPTADAALVSRMLAAKIAEWSQK